LLELANRLLQLPDLGLEVGDPSLAVQRRLKLVDHVPEVAEPLFDLFGHGRILERRTGSAVDAKPCVSTRRGAVARGGSTEHPPSQAPYHQPSSADAPSRRSSNVVHGSRPRRLRRQRPRSVRRVVHVLPGEPPILRKTWDVEY